MTGRPKLPRYLALPVIEAHEPLLTDHRQRLSEGYMLDQHLSVRINWRRMKAEVRATWRRAAPEIGPRAHRTYQRVWTVDLRKQVRAGE